MTAFVIAGTHSGVGKTTVTLSILAALRRRGLRVQAYKVGPDFIDPSHHSAISGIPSRTLDGWMLSREYNQRAFGQNLQDKDVGVVEGVMGVFDGYDGKNEAGSTAEMAKWLELPVILVVDASAMARSVAALVHGFCTFDQNLKIAGVIFNRIAGAGHLQYLRDALENVPGIAVLGGLPRDENVLIPERHLGLITPTEHELTPERIELLASFCENNLDLERMLQMSQLSSPKSQVWKSRTNDFGPGTLDLGLHPRVRFGVARDEAFCFYYPDNLELLEQAGAELVSFSPLHDSSLPPNLHGLYFGGGYPEVHAEKLAANNMMRQEIKGFIERRGIVYAECGGFMYLTAGIRDSQGTLFPLVGIYPTVARMLPRLAALGYVEVEVQRATCLFAAGSARGHEFHYSELEQKDFCSDTIEPVYQIRKHHSDALRNEGYLYKRCLASYVHLHFGSNPQFVSSLVKAAQPETSD